MKYSMKEAAGDILASNLFRESDRYLQHRHTSVMRHSIRVAELSMKFADAAEKIGIRIDERALIRGALLHDYFGYDFHSAEAPGNLHPKLHGFYHPGIAARNAERDFGLSERERSIILHHMWPLTPVPPTCRESWIVMVADKCCALKEEIG